MVVHAGAEEAELVLGARVARGELAQVLVDVLLGQARRQLERAAEAHRLGDLALEQLLDRADADRREHRGEVCGGDGGVAAQVTALSLATPGSAE